MYSLIVVEDERIIRNHIVNFISENDKDFNVVNNFSDGGEAIEYIKTHKVDVVLSDVKMLEVSGIEIAKYVYENELPIKIILISGYRDFSYAQQALTYNVSDYLTKPISPVELLNALAKIKDYYTKNTKSDVKPTQEEYQFETLNDDYTKDDLIMQKALSFIKENYNKDMVLYDVANHVNLSASYFGKMFRRNMQESFSNYVISLRISEAIKLLKTGKYSVSEVSSMVGYPNCNYFIKIFKNYTGYTPKKYFVHAEENDHK